VFGMGGDVVRVGCGCWEFLVDDTQVACILRFHFGRKRGIEVTKEFLYEQFMAYQLSAVSSDTRHKETLLPSFELSKAASTILSTSLASSARTGTSPSPATALPNTL
jgi:hypothetical protein